MKFTKVAFTLAEVLITLGIIGVVAVLTVPNLVSNYQKKVYVTQLQKGYSQLQQAFALAMAEDEVDDLGDTTLWSLIPNSGNFRYTDSDYSSFVNQLKKYIKVSKFCSPVVNAYEDSCYGFDYTNLSGRKEERELSKENRLKIYTPSGLVYYFNIYGNESNTLSIGDYFPGSIEIDVNGDKKPNKLGRDLFSLILLRDGSVIFPGTDLWAELGFNHWSNSIYYTCDLSNTSTYAGEYCGGRIFDNGWVMDY